MPAQVGGGAAVFESTARMGLREKVTFDSLRRTPGSTSGEERSRQRGQPARRLTWGWTWGPWGCSDLRDGASSGGHGVGLRGGVQRR